MQYALYFDASRCTQCLACEVACKSAHDLRPHVQEEPKSTGPRYRQVITVADPIHLEAPLQYISLACMNCGSPDCMAVCPTNAIYREDVFGVVLVDRSRCIGCHYCSWACEFGAPQFDRDGLMQKCDLCINRLREGLKPACVESCCSGAIQAGPVEEMELLARSRAASKLASRGKPHTILLTPK